MVWSDTMLLMILYNSSILTQFDPFHLSQGNQIGHSQWSVMVTAYVTQEAVSKHTGAQCVVWDTVKVCSHDPVSAVPQKQSFPSSLPLEGRRKL